MRPRSQTIGTLGRQPARESRQPIPTPPADPPPPEQGWVRRWVHGAVFDNVGLKFLSMVLAVTVFLLVNTDRDREKTVRVDVKFVYPPDKVLVSDELDAVRVTVKGPWRRVRELQDGMIERIDLDVSKTPTGEVAITPDLINLPPGLTVTAISPRTIRVAFDKRIEKLVEITAVTTGRPQHGRYVSGVTVTPTTIKARGGERLLAAITTIRTDEISLDQRTESFEAQADLVPVEGVSLDAGQRVTVRVQIEDQLVSKTLTNLALTLRGDAADRAKWTIESPQVEVTLTGKLLDVEKAQTVLAPIVRLSPGERASSGEPKPREVEVVLEGVPPGVGVRIAPDRVKIVPVRP